MAIFHCEDLFKCKRFKYIVFVSHIVSQSQLLCKVIFVNHLHIYTLSENFARVMAKGGIADNDQVLLLP